MGSVALNDRSIVLYVLDLEFAQGGTCLIKPMLGCGCSRKAFLKRAHLIWVFGGTEDEWHSRRHRMCIVMRVWNNITDSREKQVIKSYKAQSAGGVNNEASVWRAQKSLMGQVKLKQIWSRCWSLPEQSRGREDGFLSLHELPKTPSLISYPQPWLGSKYFIKCILDEHL